jgi:hypothetical protein
MAKEPKEKFMIANGLKWRCKLWFSHFQNGKEVYAIMGTWSVDSLGICKIVVWWVLTAYTSLTIRS